jgi:hypothetical protein
MLGGGHKNYSGEERLPWLCLASPIPDRAAREDSLVYDHVFLVAQNISMGCRDWSLVDTYRGGASPAISQTILIPKRSR